MGVRVSWRSMADTFKRRWVVFALVAGVIVAASAAVLGFSARARISGATPAERVACICRLADARAWGAGEAIAACAAQDADASVRRVAVLALGRYRGEQRPAIEAATRDPDAAVRAAAAMTLGLCRDEAAARRLGELAAGAGVPNADASPSWPPALEVRQAALSGLESMATPDAGEALFARLDDADPTVRTRSFEVLMNLLNKHWEKGADPWPKPRWKSLHSRLMEKTKAPPPAAHDGKPVDARKSEDTK